MGREGKRDKEEGNRYGQTVEERAAQATPESKLQGEEGPGEKGVGKGDSAGGTDCC